MNRLLKTAELFFILEFKEKTRFDLHRSDALTSLRTKSKAPPLKSLKDGYPEFNGKARAARPIESPHCEAAFDSASVGQ
jgi:hypothetical protein